MKRSIRNRRKTSIDTSELTLLSGKQAMGKISILREFWRFLRARKKWWLGPIVVFLVFFGALIVLSQGSVLAPFIYTIF